MPSALTSFVGRADEIAGIVELLSSARLVTLVGFGGLGKTRLAQEVARAMGDRFADGVWYVDLTPVTDTNVLADTIITAGGLTVSPSRESVDHLLALLEHREALIVVDNCEHVVDDVAELAERIVYTAPHVRLLSTSRVRLGVAGEATWAARPLESVSGVELFVDRARAALPGFALDATNRTDVERLCAHLDGIPLAIEMATARLAIMGVAQVTEHLDERLLTSSNQGTLARQHSVEDVLEWSYLLLDEAGRRLLRRLSVCTGGFDLEAAADIGTPEHLEGSLAVVLDSLTQLIDASFVVFEIENGSPRYRMLETVRQFCATKLEPDERDDVALAHATHYESVGVTIVDLEDTDHQASYLLAERELGNLRAAMSWAYGNGQPRLGLSIANSGYTFFNGNMLYREALRWLQTGLELLDDDDDDTFQAAAFALIEASNVVDLDAERALVRVESGLDTVEEPRLRAELLSARGAFVHETDPRAADAHFVEAIALGASTPQRTMAKLHNRVDVAWEIGRLDDGEKILQHVDEIMGSMRIPHPVVHFRSRVATLAGRWDDVIRVVGHEDPLDRLSNTIQRLDHAEALGALGRLDEAVTAIEPLEFDDRSNIDAHRTDLIHAAIDLARGSSSAAAERLARRAAEIDRDGRRFAIDMHVAALLAVAAHDLGQHETAAILFGYAAGEQERLDITLRLSHRPLADRAIEDCRAALGADRYDEFAAEGASSEWHDLPTVDLGRDHSSS